MNSSIETEQDIQKLQMFVNKLNSKSPLVTVPFTGTDPEPRTQNPEPRVTSETPGHYLGDTKDM
jgi:hypothetical protein